MSTGRDWKEWNRAWRKKRFSTLAHSLRYRLRRIKDNPQKFVRDVEPWGILAAAIGLMLAVWAFWFDYADKVEERTVRAWQLLTTKAPGNSGKKEALEYLNSEYGWCFLGACKRRVSLTGVDLSVEDGKTGAFLSRAELSYTKLSLADLRRADLIGADLSRSDLGTADLSEADLYNANLNGTRLVLADLIGADLSRSDLGTADLSEADLYNANLNGTRLVLADLSGASLSGAENLEQSQLNRACGDEGTRLPDHLTIRLCSEVHWYEVYHGDR